MQKVGKKLTYKNIFNNKWIQTGSFHVYIIQSIDFIVMSCLQYYLYFEKDIILGCLKFDLVYRKYF
jgi:hypothetical protein